MIRLPSAIRASGRFASAMLIAACAASGQAKAEQDLPPAALALRHAVVAMALADAAMPLAAAVETTRPPAAEAADLITTVALKPETADAMAAIRPSSARRPLAAQEIAVYDRRFYRPYREPFALILGIGY